MDTPDALPMTAAYFRLILGEYGTVARDRAALLADVVVAESAAEITLGQQLQQIRNANRLLPPEWALAVGARLHAVTHGPVGVAAVTAPTLRDGLGVMTRFGGTRSPHFRLRTRVAGDEVYLVPEDAVPLADGERRALLDLVMLSTQGMLEAMLGHAMHAGRFEFAHAAPTHAGRYAERLHAPVRFGARESAVVIPARWLDVACPLADPALFAALRQRLVAGEHRCAVGGSWGARVAQHIAADRGRPGLDTIARALRVSARTLVRRLGEAGTSYGALLDASQRQRAEALLRERGRTIADVAWALGYEDAANFGRACRRWFGMSPGRYRAWLHGTAEPRGLTDLHAN